MEEAHQKRPGHATPRKLLMRAAVSLAALGLLAALALFLFMDVIINSYAKARAEKAFARAYPGGQLRLGPLKYHLTANRLVAQTLTFSGDRWAARCERASLSGVRWAGLLGAKPELASILAKLRLEATNLVLEFPSAQYALRVAHLQLSGPAAELRAETIQLAPTVSDEAFLAARPFRATRFRLDIPACTVTGLNWTELLQARAGRVQRLDFTRPMLDALVSREKPRRVRLRPPLMPQEALATLPIPLEIETLHITDGRIQYRERRVAEGVPGLLTFGAVQMTASGIAKPAPRGAPVRLRAQGDLMDAGTLRAEFLLPLSPGELSLRYTGSLTAMDLPRLNAFLDAAEFTHIKSGRVQQAGFDIQVSDGRARGQLRAGYDDLQLARLDRDTGQRDGPMNRAASFLLNARIRDSSGPPGSLRSGAVEYDRNPEDTFVKFVWFALRSGVLNVIEH